MLSSQFFRSEPHGAVAPHGAFYSAPPGAFRSAPFDAFRSAPHGALLSAPHGALLSLSLSVSASASASFPRTPAIATTCAFDSVFIQFMMEMQSYNLPRRLSRERVFSGAIVSGLTHVSFEPVYFKGGRFIALMPHPTFESQATCVMRHKFRTGYQVLDEIRMKFADLIVDLLEQNHPEILQKFEKYLLTRIFRLKKSEMKIILCVIGSMIGDDFSKCTVLETFWLILWKTLIFSRYIELLISMVTNMIQFNSSNPDLFISGRCLEILMNLVGAILPTSQTFLEKGHNQCFVDETKRLLRDLYRLFDCISKFLSDESIDEFKRHHGAIQVDLTNLQEHRVIPSKIVFKIDRGMDEPSHTFAGIAFFKMAKQSASGPDFFKILVSTLGIQPGRDHYDPLTAVVEILFQDATDMRRGLPVPPQQNRSFTVNRRRVHQPSSDASVATKRSRSDLESGSNVKKLCINGDLRGFLPK